MEKKIGLKHNRGIEQHNSKHMDGSSSQHGKIFFFQLVAAIDMAIISYCYF